MPVIVTAGFVPAGALEGLMDVIVGRGFGASMVNVTELEGPPPGVGFETVTWTVPGVVSVEAGMVACKNV